MSTQLDTCHRRGTAGGTAAIFIQVPAHASDLLLLKHDEAATLCLLAQGEQCRSDERNNVDGFFTATVCWLRTGVMSRCSYQLQRAVEAANAIAPYLVS